MKLNFYKKNNNWYVNYMNLLIAEPHRMMVAGCDTLLDMAAEGKDEITLTVTPHENDEVEPKVVLDRTDICKFGGATYDVTAPGLNQNDVPAAVWICNVTLFVFGHFPKKIEIAW